MQAKHLPFRPLQYNQHGKKVWVLRLYLFAVYLDQLPASRAKQIVMNCGKYEYGGKPPTNCWLYTVCVFGPSISVCIWSHFKTFWIFAVIMLLNTKLFFSINMTVGVIFTSMQARNQGGGAFGAFAPNFQFWHLQKLSKNKDEILYSNHF